VILPFLMVIPKERRLPAGTSRTAQLAVSAMNRSPDRSTARPDGSSSRAARAGPPFPEYPAIPVPVTVVTDGIGVAAPVARAGQPMDSAVNPAVITVTDVTRHRRCGAGDVALMWSVTSLLSRSPCAALVTQPPSDDPLCLPPTPRRRSGRGVGWCDGTPMFGFTPM
jgi:hypothetical protein